MTRRDVSSLQTTSLKEPIMSTLTETAAVFTPRILPAAEAEAWAVSARQVIALPLTDAGVQDVIRLALGEFAPLTGFPSEADYLSVLLDGKLRDGTPLHAPVTLAITQEQRRDITRGQLVALTDLAGRLIGRLEVQAVYPRREHAERLARGGKVEPLGARRQWLLGGPVDVVPQALKGAQSAAAEELFPWGLS